MPNNVWGGIRAMVPCLPGRPARDGGWPAQQTMGLRHWVKVESHPFVGSEPKSSVEVAPAAAPSCGCVFRRNFEVGGGGTPDP